MKIEGEAKQLRIFVGSSDKMENMPLYEYIVYEAKKMDLAGATVLRGVMGYGASSVVHSTKILAISDDLPMIIEIVDQSDKIDHFITTIEKHFDNLKFGVLITTEKINVIRYSPSRTT
jgi:PII-like signaling protein